MGVCPGHPAGVELRLANLAKRYGWDLSGQASRRSRWRPATQPTTGRAGTNRRRTAHGAAPSAQRRGGRCGQRACAAAGRNAADARVARLSAVEGPDLVRWAWRRAAAGAAIASRCAQPVPQEPEASQMSRTSTSSAPRAGRPRWRRCSRQLTGSVIDLWQCELEARRAAAEPAVYAVEIGDDKPVLRITKRIDQPPRRKASHPAGGYEVAGAASHWRICPAARWRSCWGSAGRRRPRARWIAGPDLNVLAGYNDEPRLPEAPLIKPKAHARRIADREKQTIQIAQSAQGLADDLGGHDQHLLRCAGPAGRQKTMHRRRSISTRCRSSRCIPDAADRRSTAEMLFETKPLTLTDAPPTEPGHAGVLRAEGPRRFSRTTTTAAYPRQYCAVPHHGRLLRLVHVPAAG